jgi:hypothetical protein
MTMPRSVIVIAALILALHGAIHLMGTVAYLRLGTIDGLPYKTTVLGGHIDLGEQGIRAFGALWGVSAIAFVVAAMALLFGWQIWGPVLLAASLTSLLLTTLDWQVAFIGAFVDIGIIAVVWLVPRLAMP